MKDLISDGLKYYEGKLWVLDQAQLPMEEQWIDCTSPEQMVSIIQHLQVRGAPLIGVAAAMALALYAQQGASKEALLAAASALRAARPTAVNLMHCIDRQVSAFQETGEPQTLIDIAEALFEEDKYLAESMANHGAALIKSGDSFITHCNAGCIVSTGVGTALGILRRAHEMGKDIHVYVNETRPLLQGARLTAWEMKRFGIPHTLICDSMAAGLMRDGKIQGAMVGADRIAANGDVANKIGTYSLAVLAHHHNVPFYFAAPYTTVDPQCATGKDIVIEQRAPEEVRGFGKVCWSPTDSPVYNPAFDVTPAALITGIVLDTGVFAAQSVLAGVSEPEILV